MAPQVLNTALQRGAFATNTLVGSKASDALAYDDTFGGLAQMCERGSGGRSEYCRMKTHPPLRGLLPPANGRAQQPRRPTLRARL